MELKTALEHRVKEVGQAGVELNIVQKVVV